MNATAKRSGVDLRVVAIAVIVLLLAFGGAAAWAYSTNTDLERTRQTLTSTSTDLDVDEEDAGRHRRQGDARQGQALTDEEAAIKSDKARIDEPREPDQAQGRLHRGADGQPGRDPPNPRPRTRELRPDDERLDVGQEPTTRSNKALDLAISYLAKSYTSAAAGSYATANSWLSKSNAQVGGQQQAGQDRQQGDRRAERRVGRDQQGERRVREDARQDRRDLWQLTATRATQSSSRVAASRFGAVSRHACRISRSSSASSIRPRSTVIQPNRPT